MILSGKTFAIGLLKVFLFMYELGFSCIYTGLTERCHQGVVFRALNFLFLPLLLTETSTMNWHRTKHTGRINREGNEKGKEGERVGQMN